jgi:lipid II:glycine glycyltransferase (peptidoglycan interpeptide bridge formation enzyme)
MIPWKPMQISYVRGPLQGAELDVFEEFTANARGTHYMQQSSWQVVQSSGRVGVRYIIVRDGKKVVGTARILRGERAYWRSPDVIIERGPVVDDVEQLDRVLPAIMTTARRHGIDQVRIQPYWTSDEAVRAAQLAQKHGFSIDTGFDGPHTETLRVGLSAATAPDIFAGSQYASLRRHAAVATRQGLKVRPGSADDLIVFGKLYAAMMEQQGENGTAHAQFASYAPLLASQRAAVFCAEQAGEVEAMVIVCCHGDQITFHQGATSATKRPYKKMVLPLMAAASWGAAQGACVFDLGGVPKPDDTDSKRTSIAKFKYSFGNTTVNVTPVMYSPTTAVGRTAKSTIAALQKVRQRFR